LGKLSDLIFGTKEQRKRRAELKEKEKEAQWEGYSKGRIESARKRGYAKGKAKGESGILRKMQKGLVTVQGGIEGAGSSAKGYMTFLGFDLGSKPTKRKKKRKR